VARQIFLHGYGFSRADMEAKATALTGDRVNFKIPNSIEATQVLAQATLGAFVQVNVGYLPAPELGFLFRGRAEQQMKVSGIYIAVG
jgi:hypothetical protein